MYQQTNIISPTSTGDIFFPFDPQDVEESPSDREREKVVDAHGRPRSLVLPHVVPKSAYGKIDHTLRRSAALEAAQNVVGQAFWSKRNLYQDHAKSYPTPENADPVTRALTWVLHDPASPVSRLLLPSGVLVDSLDADQRHDLQTQADGNGAIDSIVKFLGNGSAAFSALSAYFLVPRQKDLDAFRAGLVKSKSLGRVVEFGAAGGAGIFRLMVFGAMMIDRADLALSFLAASELCSFTNYSASIVFSGDNLRDSIHQRFVEKKADATINRPMEILLEEARQTKMAILNHLGPTHEAEYEKLRQALIGIQEVEESMEPKGFLDWLPWRNQKSPSQFTQILVQNAFVRVQKRFIASDQGPEALARANQEFQIALGLIRQRVLGRFDKSYDVKPILTALDKTLENLTHPRLTNPKLVQDLMSLIDDTVVVASEKADVAYDKIKGVISQVSQAYAPVQRTWFERAMDFFTRRNRDKVESEIDIEVGALEARDYVPLKAEYIGRVAFATAVVRELRQSIESRASIDPRDYLRLARQEDLDGAIDDIGAAMHAETQTEPLEKIRASSKKIITDEWQGLNQHANGRRDMTPLMIQSKANQGIVRIATMTAALFYAGDTLGWEGATAVAQSALNFVGDIPAMATQVAQDWLVQPTGDPSAVMDVVQASVTPMTDQQVLDAKAALGGSIPLSLFAVLPLVALSINGNRKILAELRERCDQAEEKYYLALGQGSDKDIRSTRADLFYLNLTLRSQKFKTWAMALQAYPILKPVGWAVQSMASVQEWASIMFSKRKDYRATLWLSRRFGVA